MQEEVENRTVNLMISTSKLTGRTLVAAFRKYAQHRARVKGCKAAEGDHGKMTVEKLIRKDQGAQQIDIAKSGIKDFERVLNKYGVDYAIRKDVSQEPPRFMVFFKAKDADVLTAAFKEYSVKLSQKEKRPSVLKALAHLQELAKSIPSKVREKNQERER